MKKHKYYNEIIISLSCIIGLYLDYQYDQSLSPFLLFILIFELYIIYFKFIDNYS